MRIRLLGPVELLRSDGSAAGIGAAKRRSVLTALALELNRVVSNDRLLDIVWEGAPPPSARAALQNHIAQLRKLLGDGVELETRSPGYRLRADRALLDTTRFEDLLAEATAAPDLPAVSLLRDALSLRRGPVLADLPLEPVRAAAAGRFDELTAAAVEELARRLRRLGRIEEAIDPLQEAVELRPLREPLVELLVLNLHESGRQAEALDLYHRTRTRLSDELGVDPGPGLRQAFHAVLEDEPVPAFPAAPQPFPGSTALPGPAEPPQPRAIPAQLPREHTGFVGRENELVRLGPARRADGAIRVLAGPAGAGKTALALRWAHRVAGEFPDGQLFADLRGFDGSAPVQPGQVLTGFLRALGIPDGGIPGDLDQRAALYRSVLASRSMLIVLDNARSAAQVRMLLPGTSNCVVLVSSRSRLDDLIATEGAVRVPVATLRRDEAVTVLRLALGEQRVRAEPEAAAELAELCDRLPLALRIAASRGADHLRVRKMVEALSDERHRLCRLTLPDSGRAVHTALAWSYRSLGAGAARLFRLLGLHPGAEIDRTAAAALAATTVADVQAELEELVAVHLLHRTAPGRFGRHDLVRLATTEVAGEEPAAERDAATTRLLDYYLHTADAARRLIGDRAWPPAMPVAFPPAEAPHLSSADAAFDWFRAEEANLHQALALAMSEGHPDRAWRSALCVERFHRLLGDAAARAEVAGRGLTAARRAGNPRAETLFQSLIREDPPTTASPRAC